MQFKFNCIIVNFYKIFKSIRTTFFLTGPRPGTFQIKLKKVWKSLNCENYPIKLEIYNPALKNASHSLRQKDNRVFKDTCKLQKSKMSFNLDAAKLWNAAPLTVRNSKTSYEAKKLITAFVKTLPL